MPKNKDPAVLFYTSDFLVGVMCLTMEERGQYITLLCLQHQRGHLTKKEMELAVGKVSPDVMAKFTEDADGKYYNEVMDGAIEQRKNYTESRVKNGSKGGRPKKAYANHMVIENETICKPYGKPYENHSENENENKNINIDSNPNNSFSFSNKTTTTIESQACEGEDDRKADSQLRTEICDYFDSVGYKSSPHIFITYNDTRGWRGPNGVDLRKNYRWMSYADEWERRERGWNGEDEED